ncbi:MAG TPA: peptidase [Burkholderiales bacterium]|nr:peptidase [Betaproteobacteria bacterium]HQR52467.1 peptidase [Burkholderiales bacterium]
MTYGVAMMLDAGMIFASDSRTNAGVDHVASFRKMRLFVVEGNRVIVVLSSGNLSLTQGALNLLEAGKTTEGGHTIWNINSMFQGAQLLGDALREVRERDAGYLTQANVDSYASFLIGGQIHDERQRLFHIYSEGNFIEAMPETPYFQIGEIKYGKPIIDRVVTSRTSLMDAAKCVLVSFDSTMRSNVSVGLPIDILVYEHDSLVVGLQRRIVEGDAYFSRIHKMWGEGVRRVFSELPNPHWDD